MRKTVVTETPESPPKTLATFTLEPDGQVEAEYDDPRYGQEMEDIGIFVLTDDGMKTFRPEDGAPFFQALDRAYLTSSFIRVVNES